MSTLVYRLAGLCYRHRRVVLVGWFLVTLGIVSLAVIGRGATVDDFTIPGTQSQQALTQLQRTMPALVAPSTEVVFATTGSAKVTDAVARDAIESSIARLRSGPQVASVSDPFQSGLVS